MPQRIWLFGLILGIPLIALSVAKGIQAYYNSEIRSAIQKQVPNADPSVVSTATIDRLCEEHTAELNEICSTNDNLNLMTAAALGAGAGGLFLLFVIKLAGSLARTNRKLVLYLFRPGLYLTAIVLMGLVLVHAGMAIAAIYYGESVLFGRIHIFIIGGIGVGALAGVAEIWRNTFSVVQRAQTFVIGKAVPRTEAPDLWKRVDELADRLRALHPQNIVTGLDPNFFVTEADVVCLTGKLSGRTLYASLPLMRILTDREFDGVIGHELAHYKGLDTPC